MGPCDPIEEIVAIHDPVVFVHMIYAFPDHGPPWDFQVQRYYFPTSRDLPVSAIPTVRRTGHLARLVERLYCCEVQT
jgi:hypothetical protein